MTKANRTRRANRRRAIACHRGGNPLASPHWGARFDSWLAGEHQAAKAGKKSHHDLDRGHERVPASRARQYRCAARTFCPPALPAQHRRWERKPGVR